MGVENPRTFDQDDQDTVGDYDENETLEEKLAAERPDVYSPEPEARPSTPNSEVRSTTLSPRVGPPSSARSIGPGPGTRGGEGDG